MSSTPQHQPSANPSTPYGQPSANASTPYTQPSASQPGYQAYGTTSYQQPVYGAQPGYGQGLPPSPYGQQAGYAPMRREVTWKEAIQAFFKNYATFSGRASRSEYGWPSVVLSLVSSLFVLLMYGAMLPAFIAALDATTREDYSGASAMGAGFMIFPLLFGLFFLAIIIPSLALTVRRLHDLNQSGWLVLLAFVPLAASLAPVLMFLPPRPEGARFDSPDGSQPWPQA